MSETVDLSDSVTSLVTTSDRVVSLVLNNSAVVKLLLVDELEDSLVNISDVEMEEGRCVMGELGEVFWRDDVIIFDDGSEFVDVSTVLWLENVVELEMADGSEELELGI